MPQRIRMEGLRPLGRRVARVVAGVGAVAVVTGLVAANVAVVLLGDTLESFLGTDVVDVSAERSEEVMAAGRALAERVEGEGVVLVRNEDDALPIPSDTRRVNVFGWASTQWVTSGSGSGQVSGETRGILDALEAAGVEYNEGLAEMYRGFHGARDYASAGALNSRASEYCRLYEPSVLDDACYSDELLAEAEAFSDTAIVVISRVCGESVDCPAAQYKVRDRSGKVEVDVTRGYLELSREEEALLRYVGATYDRVVVLVNSTNAMELGELESVPGIDAALLVGTTGEVGADAVVKVLWGQTNPSGRTTDTYAYDLSTAASWANSGAMGEGIYVNGSGLYPADGTLNANVGETEAYDGVRFVDYVEGIYVGYRWYETADAEGFWDEVSNAHGTGYDGVVQYPFGYGLSYTSFDWEVVSAAPGGDRVSGRDAEIVVTVRVTNVGEVAGKDVVELYCTPPYEEGGIEKASTVLVDYGKTGLLAPGESEDVTLSFALDDVASYDCYDANGNGFTGYELEAGAYVVELKRDAHTLATCEGASRSLRLDRDVLCAESLATGAGVGNLFTGEDAVDGVSIDGSDSGADVTYLTRADFEGTFPRTSDPDREMADNVSALNLYDEAQLAADARDHEGLLDASSLWQPGVTSASASLLLSENGELTATGRLLGSDYDDPAWDTLLDQVSLSDMESLVLHGYLATGAIEEIGKPRTKEVDGPAQVGSFNQLAYGTGLPNATVLAQAWNPSLAREVGRQLGLECAVLGVDGWYAPCANVHRTPVGGRNFEYYSEDPLVCGVTASEVVGGSLEAGTYCFVKHFALNNQDSYRDSLYTWLTEQTLREVYLRPFQRVVESGGSGLMTSYNRVGAVWAGGSRALLTDVLRGEWGFQGAVITDYCDHQQYMNADQMLRAGGDLYMDGVFRNGSFACAFSHDELVAASGSAEAAGYATSYLANLRRATKNVIYTWLNARSTNLAYNEAASEAGEPTIERPVKTSGFNYLGTALALLDGAVGVAVVAWAHRALERRRSRRRG